MVMAPFVGLGTLGAIITLLGLLKSDPNLYFVIGALALLITAMHYKLFYFIALELILIAGHGAIILGSGPYTQLALPLLLSLQLLIFCLIVYKDKDLFLLLGIVGIALLSIGFSYHNQWIFFVGSFFIATYSFHVALKGEKPAFIWCILNGFFALEALVKLFLEK